MQAPCDSLSVKGSTTLQYCLAAAPAAASCIVRCTLLGDYLILAASPRHSRTIPQITLSLTRDVALLTSQPSGVHFPKQQATWAAVKNSLVLPVKTALCKAAGQPLPCSLLLLPSELRDRCLQLLEVCEQGVAVSCGSRANLLQCACQWSWTLAALQSQTTSCSGAASVCTHVSAGLNLSVHVKPSSISFPASMQPCAD